MLRALILILLLCVAIAGSVLASLNAAPVDFHYYFAYVQMPLALLLLLAFSAGALLGLLLTWGVAHRARGGRKQLLRTLKLREQEIRNLRDIPIKGRH